MKKYIYLISAAVLLSACGQHKEENPVAQQEKTGDSSQVKLTPQQKTTAGIQVGTAEESTLSGSIRLQGSIDVPPQNIVSVSFPLGGYLKRTSLLEGMHVNRGQVLAVLEDMQFIQLQQDYLSAKERLVVAQNEYQRYQELNASKAASDKVFQQSRAELQSQRINLQSLTQKLELIGLNPRHLTAANISKSINILSPIDGFVSKVNVNIGKYTSPTDVLFELVNPKDIHLALNVFEKDVNQLSIGQRVVAYKNDDPNKKYQAEIILISKNLDQDHMATVHCHFEDFHDSLLPGMFMNAEVATQDKKALTVNEEAIVRWENNFYVFVETAADSFKMAKINPGNHASGKQQFTASGITNATRIITKNAYVLLMKMKNSGEAD
jgi:cobalt-zinc-cadmium efflux system membrane fusion protein